MINHISITIPYLTYKHFKYGADIKRFIEKWGTINTIFDSIQQLKTARIGIDRVHEQSFVNLQFQLTKQDDSFNEMDLHNQLSEFFLSVNKAYCSIVILKILSSTSFSWTAGSQFVTYTSELNNNHDTSYNRHSN